MFSKPEGPGPGPMGPMGGSGSMKDGPRGMKDGPCGMKADIFVKIYTFVHQNPYSSH